MRVIDDGMLPEEKESAWISATQRRQLIKIGILLAALYLGWLIFTFIPYIMTGLTVYTLLLIIIFLSYEQLRHFNLRFARDHVIVCGDSSEARSAVLSLAHAGFHVVRISMDEDPTLEDRCSHFGIVFIRGSPASAQTLEKVRLSRAKAILAMDHDEGVNVEIAERAWKVSMDHREGPPLTCLVHITDPAVTRLLTSAEIWLGSRDGIRFDFFNLYQTGGALMLAETAIPEMAAEGKTYHIIVIGGGRMGKSLILHAIRLWHDRWPGGAPGPCRVTLVDGNASAAAAVVEAMMPSATGWAVIDPFDMKVGSAAFLKGDFLSGDNRLPDAVFVCLDDETLGLSATVQVREHLASPQVPLVVRTRHSHGVTAFLKALGSGYEAYRGIHPFPFPEQACTPRLLFNNIHELAARAVHEGYLAQQSALGETPEKNPSLVPWDDLPESLKESNRKQADGIADRLASIGCRLCTLGDWSAPLYSFCPDDLEQLARAEHERWMDERKAGGWTYGPERDIPLKKTPWLIPFDDLPEPEKEKDRSAIRSLPAILARFDLAIVKDTDRAGGEG